MPPFSHSERLVHERTLVRHACGGMQFLPLLRDHLFVDLAAIFLSEFGDPLRAQFARAVVLILARHFLPCFLESLAMYRIALVQSHDRVSTLEAERLLD